MNIDIPDEITRHLEQLAVRHDVEVTVLLEQLMKRYKPEKKWATMADLARNAKEAGMASPQPVNTAERSREILNTEYADYLKSRIDS